MIQSSAGLIVGFWACFFYKEKNYKVPVPADIDGKAAEGHWVSPGSFYGWYPSLR